MPELPNVLRQFLWARGFRDPTEIEDYLNPSLSNLVHPQDLLLDLNEAIRILLRARDQKSKILIFGDYDVDGTTSTALLYRSLSDLGWEVDWFIPHRVNEGYGITLKSVERMKALNKDFEVLISCDCGISSFEGIGALKTWGKSVIVTDHHECPDERVPADAVLNPKQLSCMYPAKNLAGVGVAFLLVLGLRRAIEARDYSLKSQLELVALGTVCDVAELKGANRILVKAGLKVLQQTSFPGIRAIMQQAGVEASRLRSRDLGFSLGPRFNASGRIGDPSQGLRALLADESEAFERAQKLELQNQKRRQMQKEQLDEALAQVEASAVSGHVVYDPSFHLGVVGLVAGKLAEKYSRPYAVLARVDDEHELSNYRPGLHLWKGSLRAPKGFHLAKTLQKIAAADPSLLLSYGGHAQAAGISLNEERLEDFKKVFSIAIQSEKTPELEVPRDFVLEDVSGLDRLLDWIEPIGQGNEAPRIEVQDYRIERVRVMKEEHLKIFGSWKGHSLPILHFRSPWVNIFSDLRDANFHFLGELTQNEWRGQKSLEFLLKDVLNWERLGKMNGVERKENEISHRPGT